MGGLIWIIVIVVVISEIKKFQRKNGQRVETRCAEAAAVHASGSDKGRTAECAPESDAEAAAERAPEPDAAPAAGACARIRYLGSRMCARTRWQDGRMCARTRCRDSGRRVQAGLPWQATADRSLIRRRMTY